jgi:aspartyl-tRNA(Asn)/glutamyl-tRNA(Gln) amidotransferase subunit A
LTCASKILENYISPYNATVIEKLKSQGAVLLGRLNLDEFAMGSSTETSAYKQTKNPWNLQCVPGGSSGGSAASVACGELPLSLGSDTGGSIRQPASFCGVVGLKPTYGLVSRYGLSPLANSTDQIGPFARTVEDVALLLHSICGYDKKDSTSSKANNIPSDYNEFIRNIKTNKNTYTIGIPEEYFTDGIDREVRSAVESVIEFYRTRGYNIKKISLPHTKYAVPVYYVVMTAEASSNLSRFDGIRYTHRSDKSTNAIDIYFKSREEGFGAEVKRRIMLGTFVLSGSHVDAYYVRAQKVRTLICKDFQNVFADGVDFILCPTAPTAAFKFGARKDPLQMYMSDICTIPASLAGLPAISFNCGFSTDNMPIGCQLIGNHFSEELLLSQAYRYEQESNFGYNIPEL